MKMMTRLVLVAMGALLAAPALAYPEMARYEYGNCGTCHVSINGGGVLTDYGRALSAEVLSTWKGSEDENRALWGLWPKQDLVKLGGDIRTIQTFYEDERVKDGKYFLMM